MNPIQYDGLVMVLALAFFVGYQSRGKFFDFQGQFFELVAFQLIWEYYISLRLYKLTLLLINRFKVCDNLLFDCDFIISLRL